MGDKNTSFFHKYASYRKSTNLIQSLEDNDVRLVTTSNGMAKIAKRFFKDLFLSRNENSDMEHILFGVNGCIFEENNSFLVAVTLKDMDQ